jgi:hypothetical protein
MPIECTLLAREPYAVEKSAASGFHRVKQLAVLPTCPQKDGTRKENAMTGKCAKCGKDVRFGIDGSCKHCHAEICWECWEKAGHECPNCGNFDGRSKGG